MGGPADGGCGDPAVGIVASTASVTPSCSRLSSGRSCSTASRRGASRGGSGAPRRPSATRWACRRPNGWPPQRALSQLVVVPDAAVVDGLWDFVSPHVGHVARRVKADARCLSVAAASILAKVVRDREMRELAVHYPPWSFDTNKGYPCPVHKAALQAYGPSVIHRRSWIFMDHYVPWPGITRMYRAEQPTCPTHSECWLASECFVGGCPAGNTQMRLKHSDDQRMAVRACRNSSTSGGPARR